MTLLELSKAELLALGKIIADEEFGQWFNLIKIKKLTIIRMPQFRAVTVR